MTCLTVDPTSMSPFEAAPAARNEIPSDPAFAAARDALRRADHILIGAGAGLSTAAGLAYDGPRFERLFAAFIERYGMTDMYSAGFYPFRTLADYWAYWSLQIAVNRYDAQATALYHTIADWTAQRDTFVIVVIEVAFLAVFFFVPFARVLAVIFGFSWITYAKSPVFLKAFDKFSDPAKAMEQPTYVNSSASL